MSERVFLTIEQAISLLPDSEDVHTFLNPGGMLVGADHGREGLLEEIAAADSREIAGDMARGMGHAMVVTTGTRRLFVATVEERIVALEAASTPGGGA
jgi:pyruvoyl-dependent arginine decarboxylase (PvlArgDC)